MCYTESRSAKRISDVCFRCISIRKIMTPVPGAESGKYQEEESLWKEELTDIQNYMH